MFVFFCQFFLRNACKTSFFCTAGQPLYCTAGTGSEPRKVIFADFAHVHSPDLPLVVRKRWSAEQIKKTETDAARHFCHDRMHDMHDPCMIYQICTADCCVSVFFSALRCPPLLSKKLITSSCTL